MGDLLIRNIPDGMKRRLAESAHQRGRNVSEEALFQIQRSLSAPEAKVVRAGDRLQELKQHAYFNEDEIAAMAELRKQPDRDPPSFD